MGILLEMELKIGENDEISAFLPFSVYFNDPFYKFDFLNDIAKHTWGLFIFESQITHLKFYKNPCMGTLSEIEWKMLKKITNIRYFDNFLPISLTH